MTAKIRFKTHIKNSFLIAVGILCAGMGLKGFLLPNGFLDGGAMGIALLLGRVTDVNLGVLVLLVNLPFVFLGVRQLSLGFAIRTVISVILLAIVIEVINYPLVTDDKLLIAIFGGFFLGAGIGLVMRGASVIDGTEILALYLSRITGISIGDVISIINVVIFSSAFFLVDVEIVLYAMLTYLAASRTVDFIIHGIEEYVSVTIVSNKSDEIRSMITEKLGRGTTIFNGKRGLKGEDRQNVDVDILFTVVTRLEIVKLKNEIEKIDSEAFIVQQRVDDSKGGMIKRKFAKVH